MVHRRLDSDIIPAVRSDHSTITLSFIRIEERHHGPYFWKFNASLLEDETYVSLIKDKYNSWIEEGRYFEDPRVLWDFIKYKIGQETITYSKIKKRKRREKLLNLEKNMKDCQSACDLDPSLKYLNDSEILQTEYDQQ